MADKKEITDKTESKVGELLLKEGFINQEDLARALDIQSMENKESKLPLGTLMKKLGFISEADLKILLEHPDLKKQIGELLVDKKMLKKEELEKILQSKRPHEQIGQTLIREGYMKRGDVDAIIEKQKDLMSIGELATRLNMISEADLVKVVSFKNSGRTLGEILCSLNLIQADDLNHVLKKHNKQLKIGEMLIKQGIIDEKQFKIALSEKNYTNERVGAVLIRKKFCTTDELYNTLSKQYSVPYDTLDHFFFDEGLKKTLIRFVGEKYARANIIIPLSLDGDILKVGLTYPDSFAIIDDMKKMYSNLSISSVFITEDKFQELFVALYNKHFKYSEGAEEGPIDDDLSNSLEINIKEFTDEGKHTNQYGGADTAVRNVVDYIVKYGIAHGASDIHIEQDREGAKLRYRKDGVCMEPDVDWLKEKLKEMPGAIISRIKVMSNLDIAEKRMPQDGVFRVKYYDKQNSKHFDLDFRVATCPAIVGENITIRILDSRKANKGLDTLNHSKHVLDPLKRLFKSSAGMILVSGPTGSGKTSTLYSALQYIYNPGIKIITAEDPIEYSFPGIMQTQVKSKIKLDFARLLRSFLRLDPDVILVGEMRDQETANIGFDAAQTGHLLLSTIHTNDAVSAVTRLIDLNVESNKIASSLLGVIAQRLVRKNCSKCSRVYTPPEQEWQMFFNEYPDHMTFYKGVGCKACDFTGYAGRTLISELFENHQEVSFAISKRASEKEIKTIAIEKGMKTMLDDGMLKTQSTTLSELIRMVPIEMINDFKMRQSDENEPQQAMDDELNGGIMIHNPASQIRTINRLFESYQRLNRNYPMASDKTTAQLFHQFISENYSRICETHGCKTVRFNIENIKNRYKLTAEPERTRI